ncbi:MAG: LuxR C-terminal-related transcriptional regulator [Pseudomonadota bacterium]
MDKTAYKELVLKIYQAVSDPDEWVPVLDQISDMVGARGGMLIELQRTGGDLRLEAALMTSSYNPDRVETYFKRHRAAETRDHAIFDRRLLETDGIDLIGEDILYEDRATYLAQPHVAQMAEWGIVHRTGALLDKDNPFRARFSLAFGQDRGPLTDADMMVLRDILPHLAKALELSRPVGPLTQDRPALLALLDLLDVGICLVDAQGRLVEQNAEFRRQSEDYRAFSTDPVGRLRLSAAQDHARLTELLADTMAHAKYGARPRKEAIVIKVRDRDASLCVEILPLPRSEALGSGHFGGALVISRDAAAPVEFDMGLVRQVFELTSTEASVLQLLSHGLTNPEIADRRERSVETVNAQIKSILMKTRTPNRTQLVRMLCNFSGPGGAR